MGEKKEMKISLSTFILILALILIAVMTFYIYKLYNENIEATKNITDLQAQVNNLNESINNFEKSQIIVSKGSIQNSSTSDKKVETFTDDQIKTALSNYLELYATMRCDMFLEKLDEKGSLVYDYSKDTILDDGIVITNIKFSEYKNAMLNYVSETEFEKNWTSQISYTENKDGYLTKYQGGGGLCVFTVNSITKNNDSSYTGKVTVTFKDADIPDEDEEYNFTISSYNGNCVINSSNLDIF